MDAKRLTMEEQKDVFGADAIADVYQDKLSGLYKREEELEEELKATHKANFKLSDDHKWFGELRIERIEKAIASNRKLIKKFKYRKKAIKGEIDTSRSVDLDAIKMIPCENFLPDHIMRGNSTIHYKAPWRNERNASVVVYTKNNRFHDFGDPDKRGTVIDLIMLLEGVDFKGAVNYLKSYI